MCRLAVKSILQVIYYETSDKENLDGGQCYKETTDADDVTTCSSSGEANEATDDVIFTKSERDDNTALLVQATSDGNDGAADLYLTETGTIRWCLRRLPAPDRR